MVVLVLLLAACGGGEEKPPAPVPVSPTTTPPPTTTTTAVAVPVPTIPGSPRTTTTVPTSIGPGDAALSGTVAGPDGAVAGAVVRVERLVTRGSAVAELRTDESGAWSLGSVLGGPYRITAFRSPDLGAFAPQLFFLGADERRSVAIGLARFGANTITARIEPNPPKVGVNAVFTVRIGTGRVSADGVVSVDPSPAVGLQLVSEGLSIDNPLQLTDGDGRVSWQVRCLGTGTFPVTLVVGRSTGFGTAIGASSVPFPACAEGPPPPPPPRAEDTD